MSGRMGRKRKCQETDKVTEAASSNTAKERSSRGRGKRPRQMTGSSDLNLGSSSHSSKVTIHQLDDLTLTEIFGKLDKKTKACVARVCKRWRDLVDNPTLWKHTTIRLNTCSLFSAHLDSLKRRGIRRVMVTKGNISKRLRMLIYGLSSLETLDVGNISVSKQRLAEVFPEVLPSLKKLVLRLDTLDFEGMEYIGRIFQNLSHLVLYVWHDQELTNVPDQPTKMPCLTSLRIYMIGIGDQMLHYLSRACPNLKELFAWLSSDVTDDGMQQLAQLKEIQQLEVGFDVFPPLSSTLTAKLQKLHVVKFGCSDVGDEQLNTLAQLPELEELEMGCRNISEEGWRALGQGFRKLKCLELYRVHLSEDAEVESFGSLLLLEKIVFKSLRATDLQMKSLCCALNHIHSMTIVCGPKTNHGYMKDIADMKNLKEFSLQWTQIGDEELKQLAEGRAPLESLAVITCGVHDQSLLLIAQQKKSLRKLELNQKIKVATLSKIVRRLPDLQDLKTEVSAATKLRLQRLNPRLIVSCFPCGADYLVMLDFLE